MHCDRRPRHDRAAVADFLAKMGKEVPLGRVGTAQEFANIACFLASDAGGIDHRFRVENRVIVDGQHRAVL